MKKFLILYHAPISAREMMAKATPDQAKAGMNAWMAWAAKAGDAIVELGSPVGNSRNVNQTSVQGNDTSVVGYSVLQGNSQEAVTELLKDHPHLRQPGFSIEVFQSLAMPGM